MHRIESKNRSELENHKNTNDNIYLNRSMFHASRVCYALSVCVSCVVSFSIIATLFHRPNLSFPLTHGHRVLDVETFGFGFRTAWRLMAVMR